MIPRPLRALGAIALGPILFAAEQPNAPATHPTRPWSDVATLSLISTSGNSEGKTLGFANEFSYAWDLSLLVAKAGFLKVSSATVARSASGPSLGEASVTETRTWKTTAESRYLNLRKDDRLLKAHSWYWFSSLGWEQNQPTGLEARYACNLGMGRFLLDGERSRLRTDLGLGYTKERPSIKASASQDNYWTLGMNLDFKQKIGDSAQYTLEGGVIEDLSKGSDWRFDLKQGLSAALNHSLALKVGYECHYRQSPKLIAVTAYSSIDTSTALGTLYVPARRMDTLLTASLVATF